MRDDIYLNGTETRFKKGQSGNPNGRPKGSRGKSKLIRQCLGLLTEADHQSKGDAMTLSIEELVTITIVGKALKGNTAAYRAVMDSAYGKS